MRVNKKRPSKASIQKKIACLTKAAAIAVRVFPYVIKAIRPGITEKEIARVIYRKIKEFGGEGISFRTLVASGTRSSTIHGRPSNKKIKVGDQILLDYGAVYKGYRSDISRTLFLGTMTPKQKKMYTIVLKAQARAVKLLKEGADCADIDSCARNFITKAGFGKKFMHSTGHGLGLKVHDDPRISTKSTDVLKVGDVVTVEPGIYIKGWGGIRIEDDYVITKNGAVCITGGAEKNKAVVIPVQEYKRTGVQKH